MQQIMPGILQLSYLALPVVWLTETSWSVVNVCKALILGSGVADNLLIDESGFNQWIRDPGFHDPHFVLSTLLGALVCNSQCHHLQCCSNFVLVFFVEHAC